MLRNVKQPLEKTSLRKQSTRVKFVSFLCFTKVQMQVVKDNVHTFPVQLHLGPPAK